MVNRHSALSREIAMSPDISNDDKVFVTLTALLLTQGIVYHTQCLASKLISQLMGDCLWVYLLPMLVDNKFVLQLIVVVIGIAMMDCPCCIIQAGCMSLYMHVTRQSVVICC